MIASLNFCSLLQGMGSFLGRLGVLALLVLLVAMALASGGKRRIQWNNDDMVAAM